MTNTPKKTSNTTMARAVSAAVFASAISAPGLSQTLEEVIVTATKRSESVQDVPLAITALSGDFMDQVNLTDVKDLVTFTPGVTGISQDSFIDAISVRGIRTQDFGVGGDPSSAFFKNDLYEGRNGSAVTSLYDLDRAEILRGPQGFLFGRSAIGGAFSVHTRRAVIDSNDGYINLDGAERDRFAADAAINVPVNDSTAMRFAGLYSTEDGFVSNKFPSDKLIEHENWALRWSTTYESDKLGIYTTVEYEEREQSGSVYRAVTEGDTWEQLEAALGPIDVRGSDEDVDVDRSLGDNDDADILTLGMRIDYDLGFAQLTSNTGYKDHDYYYNEDYDGTPLHMESYRQDQSGEYFQQEFRLNSNADGPLQWYAGVSYYREEIDTEFTFAGEEDLFCQYYGYYYWEQNFDGCEDLYNYYAEYYGSDTSFSPHPTGILAETGRVKGDYEGWGAYLNLNYFITDDFDIEVGVRWTDDEKEFETFVPTPESQLGPYWAYLFSTAESLKATESWDDVTPRVIAKWRPTDDAMLFLSYTEGFKSGGFDSFVVKNSDGLTPWDIDPLDTADKVRADGFTPATYDPESVDSIEFGYKDTWMDGLANSDLTLFYYEYEDLQVPVSIDRGPSIIRNIGEVEAWGGELSITSSLGEYFTAYLAVGYLDSEANELQIACGLDDPNGCEGRRIFWAPEWSGSFVLMGNYPLGGGALTGSYELMWESERGGGWEDLRETRIDSYEEMNLRVGYESDGNWYVEAYVENLTDEFTWDGMNNLGLKEPHAFFGPRRPRTFGMRAGLFWD